MKRKLTHFWHIFGRHSFYFLSILLVAIFVTWLVTYQSQSQTEFAIIIAAISAIFSAISSIATLKQATEAQRQRENQERPYITVYFDDSNQGLIYINIQNCGNSPALDISIIFEPEPIDLIGRKLSEISLFQNPIRFMPAGKTIRQIIDMGYKILAEGKPTKFKVNINYYSIAGQLFDESNEHDLAYLKDHILPGKSTEDNLLDISKQIEKIKDILNSVRGMNSLLVETPKEFRTRKRAYKYKRQGVSHWKVILRELLENILENIC